MLPYLLLNDSNAVKKIILKQTKQIEYLKRQLEEYKRDASTETTSVSPPLVCNAPTTPTSSASITSGTISESIAKVEFEEPTVPSDSNNQPLSTSPVVKSEEKIGVPSVSPSEPKRIVLPLPKMTFKLNQLPSKQTFKKRIKAAIELDGYSRDAHFQHLIYQDSTLPSHTKDSRWNFAFRFCSYFVLSGRKIFVNTLIHGNKRDNKKTSIDSFPGLRAFLRLKRIDAALLEKPLSEETVNYFTKTKHQLEIVKFLYAFCLLLYVFLPQEKRVYKVRGNVSEFHLSANAKTSNQQAEERNEKEIKEEMNPDSELMKSGLKAKFDY